MIYQPSYQLRLDRALQHLESVQSESRSWLEEDSYRLWTEFDIQSGEKLLCVEVLKQPPARFGPIIGDCVHNFRAALDNLAYELALAYYKGRLSRSMAGDPGFPTLSNSADFADKGKRMIRGIHPTAKTIIEGLQPYNRQDDPDPADELWLLAQLSNFDKHRLPHITFFVPKEISFWSSKH